VISISHSRRYSIVFPPSNAYCMMDCIYILGLLCIPVCFVCLKSIMILVYVCLMRVLVLSFSTIA
jgi:hypothetical protein